ncbi:MAG: leucine-rich repeat protein [Clostridia bacterium]|nr:leucine-rich repeat protein [Clostridia bacterium]
MNVCYKCQKKIEQPEFCTECGSDIPLFRSKCPSCGMEVRWVKFCPKCRNDLREQAKNDGLTFEELTPTPAPAVQTDDGILRALHPFTHIANEDGTYIVTGLKNKYTATVQIPEGVVAIAENAFAGQAFIQQVHLPSTLIAIEAGAFKGCRNLLELHLSESLVAIGSEAFADCAKLKNPSLPSTVDVSSTAFNNTKWQNELKAERERLEAERREKERQLTLLDQFEHETLPDGTVKITKIKNKDVYGDIEIPDCVTVIAARALERCPNITTVTIPSSVTSIGMFAFVHCEALEEIRLSPQNRSFKLNDGVLYSADGKNLVLCPSKKTGCFSIPSTVSVIEHGAFSGCYSITSISIPDSVKIIRWAAFVNCKSLTSITIPSSVTKLEINAFWSCTSLKDIYCKAPSQPSGWNSNWKANCSATVHWGAK